MPRGVPGSGRCSGKSDASPLAVPTPAGNRGSPGGGHAVPNPVGPRVTGPPPLGAALVGSRGDCRALSNLSGGPVGAALTVALVRSSVAGAERVGRLRGANTDVVKGGPWWSEQGKQAQPRAGGAGLSGCSRPENLRARISEVSDPDRAEGALCHCPLHRPPPTWAGGDPEGAAQLGPCSQAAGPGLGDCAPNQLPVGTPPVGPRGPQGRPLRWVAGLLRQVSVLGTTGPGRQVLPRPDAEEPG